MTEPRSTPPITDLLNIQTVYFALSVGTVLDNPKILAKDITLKALGTNLISELLGIFFNYYNYNTFFRILCRRNTHYFPFVMIYLLLIFFQERTVNASIAIQENIQKVTDSYAIMICKKRFHLPKLRYVSICT